MKFLRELSINNINDIIINGLEQEGFTLIWRENSVEVWYQDKVLNPDRIIKVV